MQNQVLHNVQLHTMLRFYFNFYLKFVVVAVCQLLKNTGCLSSGYCRVYCIYFIKLYRIKLNVLVSSKAFSILLNK